MNCVIPELKGFMVKHDLVSPKYKFNEDCKLEKYLRRKSPILFSKQIVEFAICRVLLALHMVIEKHKMFDFQNPTLIIFDDELKSALGFRCTTSGLLPRKIKGILIQIDKDSIYGEASYIAVHPERYGREVSNMTLQLFSAVPKWSNISAWALRSGFERRSLLEKEDCLVEISGEMNEFLLHNNHQFEEDRLISYPNLTESVNAYLDRGRDVFTNPESPGYFFLPEGNPLSIAFGGVKVFSSTQISTFIGISIVRIKS